MRRLRLTIVILAALAFACASESGTKDGGGGGGGDGGTTGDGGGGGGGNTGTCEMDFIEFGQNTNWVTIKKKGTWCSIDFKSSDKDGVNLLKEGDTLTVKVNAGSTIGKASLVWSCDKKGGACYGSTGTIKLTKFTVTADDIKAQNVSGKQIAGEVDAVDATGTPQYTAKFSFDLTFP
jgi:hypothetical protein